MEVSGTFAAPMSFRTFPQDTQQLPITIALDDTTGDQKRAMLRWGCVRIELSWTHSLEAPGSNLEP
jgi:hypothetical protein